MLLGKLVSFFFVKLPIFIPCFKKNITNQGHEKPFHILRYPTVVFHTAFPSLLASYCRNGAKTVCIRFRNGAKVAGQRRESFLHKVKIISARQSLKCQYKLRF